MNEIVKEGDFAVAIPTGDALAVFTTEGKIDPILGRIRKEVDTFLSARPDVTTAKGRDAIKSFAFKVTKSKTALEAVGKDLAAEAKKIPGKIDATRRQITQTLDAWRDEVRAPLTEWEAAEERRVNRIKEALAELQGTIDDQTERTAECIRDRLAEVKAEAVTEERFAEYTGAAAELKDKAIAALDAKLAATEKREAEAAELAQLRKEAEERAQKEREEAIRREAAEQAKRDAEAKAQAEREAAGRRERDLKAAAERAEWEKAEAEARAIRVAKEAKAAVEREIKERQDREAAEAAKREADKKHRAAINREAMAALVAGGLGEGSAKRAVELIALRQVPNISISY